MSRSTEVGVRVGRYFLLAAANNLGGLQATHTVLDGFFLQHSPVFSLSILRIGWGLVVGVVTNYKGAGNGGGVR